jgi:hypothetical protein
MNTVMGTGYSQADLSGHTIDLEVVANTADGNPIDLNWAWTIRTYDPHGHDPDPGVVESFPGYPQANANDKLLPSGVDLKIDGSTVASDIGSGEFTHTEDITGEFVGGVNDIELTSDSIGFVTAIVKTQTHRRGETT